ncbi:MAG: hypothetical protein IPL08_00215 [Saprospiraceae bacterium]|nr:hypothetical protein [Saprospiraceae bacterium]
MPINFSHQQRQALLAALGNGRPNAIGARRLAQILGYPTGGNQVQLRTLIKECIENDNDLIGATTGQPAGFFIISNTVELEAYLDSLENRTRSDNDRRTALINSWNNQPNIPNTIKLTLTIQ